MGDGFIAVQGQFCSSAHVDKKFQSCCATEMAIATAKFKRTCSSLTALKLG
jgi:hypothetical protein